MSWLKSWGLNKTKGEPTQQLGLKRPIGETAQGEMTHGLMDLRVKRLTCETTRYSAYYSVMKCVCGGGAGLGCWWWKGGSNI